MWCDHCRAEASTSVSAETGKTTCATCGNELSAVRRPATAQARELLQRWSAELDLEQTPKILESTSDHRSSATSDDPIVHPLPANPSSDAPRPSNPTEKGAPEMPEHTKPRPGDGGCWPAPTVQITSAWPQNQPPKSKGSAGQLFGHLLAYVGILAVTAGTAFVIWGYYGGPAEHAPTGWLVAAGGQMLLFLGLATLVSEGLEKSTRQSQSQFELLDHRLDRLERNAAKTAIQNRRENDQSSTGPTRPLRQAMSA